MTYRCRACLGIYLSPQGGVLYFHTCPPVVDPATGRSALRDGHRDENIVQAAPRVAAAESGAGGAGGISQMVAGGAGADLLSEDDLVTGADVEQLKVLRTMPAIDSYSGPLEQLRAPMQTKGGR